MKKYTILKLLKDSESIFKAAIGDGNFSLALKVKELQWKLLQNQKDNTTANPFNLSQLSDEEINLMISQLKQTNNSKALKLASKVPPLS